MRVVYNDGDILFAKDVNAIAYPIPDGQDFIGRGPKVKDDYLDDSTDQIKSRFYNFYNRLKVSHQSGLTFTYLPGLVLLNNGVVVSIPSGNIAITDNATSFIYVNSSGVVSSSSNLPNESLPLALVVTSGGLPTNITDLREVIIDRITPATIPVQQLIPSGTGMDYWGNTLPSGWLWCDGSLYSPTLYPTLFSVIGYTYGQSGSNFRVPDKRGRVSVAAGQGTGLTNRVLGQTFGEENVTLNVNQLPSHSHGINDPGHSHGVNDPGHNHGVNDLGHRHNIFAYSANTSDDRVDGLVEAGAGVAGEVRGPNSYILTNASGNQIIANSGSNISIFGSGSNVSVNGAGTGISINSQGGGGSHNNIQPSIVCNYMIKI